jgi:hypothetical protein
MLSAVMHSNIYKHSGYIALRSIPELETLTPTSMSDDENAPTASGAARKRPSALELGPRKKRHVSARSIRKALEP